MVGCVPMLLAHGTLSLLMVFPLVSLAAGDWRQAFFLLWWLIGTAGMVALLYSSVTFRPSSRRLPFWQVGGLLGGILAAIPLLLGFAGELWVSASALLACSASAYILASTSRSSKRAGDGTRTTPNQAT